MFAACFTLTGHDTHVNFPWFLFLVGRISPLIQCSPGGTPLYKPYRYVPPQRIEFLRRFGLKTHIDFDHFGLESGTVFEGTMAVPDMV